MALGASTVTLAEGLPPVRRLGLASRGGANLTGDDVRRAVDAGMGYLHWSGQPDGVTEALAAMDPVTAAGVVVATQVYARGGMEARQELGDILAAIGRPRLDVAIFYYVESDDEWAIIARRDGALENLRRAQAEGRLGAVGLTTHDHALAARLATERPIDLLQIRYNAADRAAEETIFPAARESGIPIIAYTCLRWGALLRNTPHDPPGFVPPRPPDYYRWVLDHDVVSLALCAPDESHELDENLTALDGDPPTGVARDRLEAHGERVRRYTATFR